VKLITDKYIHKQRYFKITYIFNFCHNYLPFHKMLTSINCSIAHCHLVITYQCVRTFLWCVLLGRPMSEDEAYADREC